MEPEDQERLRERLARKKDELTAKLGRIRSNVQRGLDPDSAERAKQLEDRDVVDALGKDAVAELEQIAAAFRRMDQGRFGICASCGSAIEDARLEAYPYATRCIACAREDGVRSAS
jgi:RNA polymerase-binding protein DksA